MSLGAYVCGWFVTIDPDLGRTVTTEIRESIKSNGLAYTRIEYVWPDARPDNGEPTKGAVLVIVNAPDDTHKALQRLSNNEVVPLALNANSKSSIEGFLLARGISVDLTSADTRRDAAGRVARALNGQVKTVPSEAEL